MKRGTVVLTALSTVSLFFLGGALSFAQTGASAPILIAEVQTGSSASASQEFIELVNTTADDLDVSEWRVEYFSATPKNFETPSRIIPLHGTLPAGKHYLLASSSYLVGSANDSFSAGLAATGGHLRLVTNSVDPSNPTVYDMLGWGTASTPEGVAAAAAPAGQSLQRKIDTDQEFVDTDNNSDDFIVGSPNPEGFIPNPETPDPEIPTDSEVPTDPISEEPTDETPSEPDQVETIRVQQIDITELLPNPASPQTDAADEFIELYNPSDDIVELTGYKLQTGTTYSHTFEFNDQTIQPKTYKAFYVRDTGVVLANSAGKARLIGPDGIVMSETADYSDAPEGQTWAWDGSAWQWSTTITANAANLVTTKSADLTKEEPKPKAATKKSSTKVAKATAKKASAKSVKGAKANGSGAGATQIAATQDQVATGIHPAVLAGVGSLAVLYGIYEYRNDLANAFHRLRNYRKNR